MSIFFVIKLLVVILSVLVAAGGLGAVCSLVATVFIDAGRLSEGAVCGE